MTVALVWTLLVWTPANGMSGSYAVIDAFPTRQHCEAMAHEMRRRSPGWRNANTSCIQRQRVVASK